MDKLHIRYTYVPVRLSRNAHVNYICTRTVLVVSAYLHTYIFDENQSRATPHRRTSPRQLTPPLPQNPAKHALLHEDTLGGSSPVGLQQGMAVCMCVRNCRTVSLGSFNLSFFLFFRSFSVLPSAPLAPYHSSATSV